MKVNNIIEVLNLQVWSDEEKTLLLKNVSFRIPKNKILGMIGESGSGKTMIAKSILGLNDVVPGIVNGTIRIRNKDVNYTLIDIKEGFEEKYKSFLNNYEAEPLRVREQNTTISGLTKKVPTPIKFNAEKLKHDIKRCYEDKELYGTVFAMIFQDPRSYIYPYWQVEKLLTKLYKRAVERHSVDIMDIRIPLKQGYNPDSVRAVFDQYQSDWTVVGDLIPQESKNGYFPLICESPPLAAIVETTGKEMIINLHIEYEDIERCCLHIKDKNTNIIIISFELSPRIDTHKLLTIEQERSTIKYKVLVSVQKLIQQEVKQILNKLNLEGIEKNYPNRLSGGQGQRLMISLCLALKCNFFIADEPTTGLDVSAQALVIQFLKQIKHDKTILLISHDMYLMNHLADYLLVIYKGDVLEFGDFNTIKSNILSEDDNDRWSSSHPYTKALFEIADKNIFSSLDDSVEDNNIHADKTGCVFYSKCKSPYKKSKCLTEPPPYFDAMTREILNEDKILSSEHFIRCWGMEENL